MVSFTYSRKLRLQPKSENMATASTIPGSRVEQRGLAYWMERVLEELDEVRTAPEADAVHDLRVALRRCRSLARVMEEVDPDPAWPKMRKIGSKLFKQLGALRDTQVLEEWVSKLGAEGGVVRQRLLTHLGKNEAEERAAALRAAGKFDAKAWKSYERVLGHRARIVAPNSLAAKSLALERLTAARELHLKALRTVKPEPWHELRIGVKRFRYTVESLLPELYESWGEDLKRVQDLLGEVHDLDVRAETIAGVAGDEPEEARASWMERIAAERETRLDEYRQLCMGEKRLWQDWKQGLPQGEQLEAAAMARLQATAKALGANGGKAAQVARLALKLYRELGRLKVGGPFSSKQYRKVMEAAARLHGIGAGLHAKSPEGCEEILAEITVAGGLDGAGVGFAGAGGEVPPGKRTEGKTKRIRAADERRAGGALRDGGSVAAGAGAAEMRSGVQQGLAGGAISRCVDCAGARVGGQ